VLPAPLVPPVSVPLLPLSASAPPLVAAVEVALVIWLASLLAASVLALKGIAARILPCIVILPFLASI